ncbi:MAG TPA: DUF2939 domain-containing protein [Pyrinomonadaceae bacterium]|nr:DUF2939 domain-containing protein [Pyrinomonadaceae bacterium]
MAPPEGERPKRNRIIINLERAREAAHIPPLPKRGSRGARILALVGVAFVLVLVAIALGAFLWWQSYKTKPAYSLALLVDAVQRGDEAAFNELVDTDKVVENFVPQVTEKAIGRYAAALTAPVRKQVEALVPKLLPGVKAQVREEVTKKIRELSARAEGKPFFLIALGMPYVVDIKEEGETARVMANLNDRQVELTMVRQESRWKIVGVKDDVLANQIVDRITKDLPAIGSDLEKQIRKNLPKDVDKKLPKNMNVDDIRKNLPNIPGITDNGNANSNENGNNNEQ